jgi:hypothetical protein
VLETSKQIKNSAGTMYLNLSRDVLKSYKDLIALLKDASGIKVTGLDSLS